jgi:hypothetical protein
MIYWLPGSVAFWAAYAIAWQKQGVEEARRVLWKRVGYATRYGRIGLDEAMSLGQDHLQEYIEALGDIVAEENKSPGAGSFQNA